MKRWRKLHHANINTVSCVLLFFTKSRSDYISIRSSGLLQHWQKDQLNRKTSILGSVSKHMKQNLTDFQGKRQIHPDSWWLQHCTHNWQNQTESQQRRAGGRGRVEIGGKNINNLTTSNGRVKAGLHWAPRQWQPRLQKKHNSSLDNEDGNCYRRCSPGVSHQSK